MIEGCKVNIAMENSADLIKQKATFITTEVNKDGLCKTFNI